MLRDLDVLKKQLQGLADVVNSFKSETVQLKVMELLFEGIAPPADPPGDKKRLSPRREKRRSKTADKNDQANRGKKSRARAAKGGRPGPGATVKQLIDTGFFKKPKRVEEIISHCQSNMAYSYKSPELAVSLLRAVRAGSLKRHKNEDGQFEYSE